MGIWDKIRKLAFEQEDTYNDQEITEQPVVNPYKVAVFDLSNASIEEKIDYILTYRSHGEQIQYADKLLQEGPYELALYMYEQLMARYPSDRDKYKNGAGLAMVKMNKYAEAVGYFKEALQAGMHPDISEKLIWQAAESDYKDTAATALISVYEQDFPNGKYIAEAVKILYPTEDLVLVQQKNIEVPFEVTNPEVVQKITVAITNPSSSGDIAEQEKAEAITESITLQDHTAAIETFLETYFEPSNIQLFVDDDEEFPVHIYHIKASDEQPFHLLLSNGMSRVDMPTPEGAEFLSCAELICLLPPEFHFDVASLQNLATNWPVTWMRSIARLSAYQRKWFTYGSMFSHAGENIGETEFSHLVLLNSTTLPEELQVIQSQDKTIVLYALIPLLPIEAEIRKTEGVDALIQFLAANKVRDIATQRT